MDMQERASSYKVARGWWAHGQEPMFRSDVAEICSELGFEADEALLDAACHSCVDELKFGYPAEYRLADLIGTNETYNSAFARASDLMKRYRIAFVGYRKRDDA